MSTNARYHDVVVRKYTNYSYIFLNILKNIFEGWFALPDKLQQQDSPLECFQYVIQGFNVYRTLHVDSSPAETHSLF